MTSPLQKYEPRDGKMVDVQEAWSDLTNMFQISHGQPRNIGKTRRISITSTYYPDVYIVRLRKSKDELEVIGEPVSKARLTAIIVPKGIIGDSQPGPGVYSGTYIETTMMNVCVFQCHFSRQRPRIHAAGNRAMHIVNCSVSGTSSMW